MENRAHFRTLWLGVALILPQLLLVLTFFYWPTGAALFWAFTLEQPWGCLLYTSPSPRDVEESRMPSSA